MTSVDQSPDRVDSVHVQTTPSLNPVWLETEVNLPCYFSAQGKGFQIALGDGVGQYGLNERPQSPDNPLGFSTLRAELKGSGPARVRFTADAALAVLDAVDFEQPDGRLLPAITLGTPPLTWTLYGGQPWQVVPHEATGLDRYRARLHEPLWMETIVHGPGRLGFQTATFPDRDQRVVDAGWIPYSGPQRVLISRPANSLVATSSFTATAPIEAWTDSPGISWTTGGDVPWQSTFDGTVRSGLVWPGETSWIEAAVTGPGVLFWDSLLPQPLVGFTVTCDGTAMPTSTKRGWLHLAAGAHRIRWSVANPRNGQRITNGTGAMILKNVAFTPQPDQSVSSVLGSGSLNFLEVPPTDYESAAITPLPWPSPIGWRLVEDPGLPGPAVQGEFGSGSLTALLPSAGRLTTLLKMEGATYPGAVVPTTEPASAAPFPWSQWTTTPRLPQGDGFRTLAAQSAFTPHPAVTLGEAIEQPDAGWTAESEPPGLWLPLEDPSSTQEDKDSLFIHRMEMTDRAWLESNLTGPVRVTYVLDGIRSDSNVAARVLMDDTVVFSGTAFSSSGLSVQIPNGNHKVRFEFLPYQPIRTQSGLSIRTVITVPITLPDVEELVDAPGLVWAFIGTGTPTAVTTGTHDGEDALGLASNRLAVGLTGPGLLRFWIKAASSLRLDELPVPVTSAPSSTWVPYTVPIPHGPHTFTIPGSSNTVVDELSYQPLPSLSAEEALDAPPGVSVVIPDPDSIGAAAFPGLSDDGSDCLLLMPETPRRLAVQVPPMSTLNLRVRAAFGAGTFGFEELPSANTSATWTTCTVNTRTEVGQSTIYLRARSVPVLIDQLRITTHGPPYFAWATAAGLPASQQDVNGDQDGDRQTNFAEYAHGLDPTIPDAHRLGTDTVPGLPDVGVFTDSDGLHYLEVRYWRRGNLAAWVETAVVPSGAALLGQPAGWTTSYHPSAATPHPGDWYRVVWRSPTPIVPGTQLFARVRTYMP